jgi:tetratricopeptide (TPR) repeat protein
MKKNISIVFLSVGSLVLVLSTLQAQDAQIVADNLEYSREFYAGVHFSAIVTVPRASAGKMEFKYDRYPNGGPERIQCDEGQFARKNGKTWLKSNDWGESGQPVGKDRTRKLDGWLKLIEAAFNPAPATVKLVDKSKADGRFQWIFEARAPNGSGPPTRWEFAKPTYDKNESVLLHGFEGSMRVEGDKVTHVGGTNPVKFSFGYLISAQGFELSERAWENLETPRGEEGKPPPSFPTIGPKPKDAQAYVDRAKARRFNGDAGGAIADFSRALELDPKLTSIYYDRGITNLQNGSLDEAISDLSHAIELSPNTADYYNDRGLAKLRKGDNDGAIADFTRAIELDPKAAQIAYRNRALARKIKGDADGAIADYDRAIDLDPKNADAYNNRGNVKKSKGDFDGAIADFTSAIHLNSKLTVAYKSRAEAKQAKGDAAGAAEDFKRAGGPDSEESQPNGNEANFKEAEQYYDRGLTAQQKRDWNGALAGYSRAIELNPKYVEAYNNRGYVKRNKGDVDGAIADYSRALDLDPQHTKSYNNRGVAKVEKGDFDGAIADFNRAIDQDPQYAHAFYGRGHARLGKKDLDGAIADFSSAIKFDAKDAADYHSRAQALAEKRQYAAAIKDLEKAAQLDPKNGSNYVDLGWYQLFNRKPRDATTACLKALKLSPEDAVLIKTNLAHSYLFSNQFAKAKALYLENKDAKIADDKRSFSQAVLDDFKEFREAGITHPDMEKIQALFANPSPP